MAWTTTSTLTSDVDDSVVTLWEKGVILTATPETILDQVVTVKRDINSKSIQFTKYANMSLATTALVEADDPNSVVITDTAITVTPVEYGNVVTTTKLANFQTGGKIDMAAAQLVGRNMGASVDKIGMTVAEAFSTTVIYPNAATAASNLTVSDVLDLKFANRLYNKLARANVTGINGNYIGIAHDDVLFDLRDSLIPVKQYADLTSVMTNEVGMAAGIRWLRSGNVTVTADSNGTIDSYKTMVYGFNALGKAVSEEPHPVISGPFDKLGRFTNVGWYGVFKHAFIDTANAVQGITASSVGSN